MKTPAVQCGKCGRKSVNDRQGQRCGMTQPDGTLCDGLFREESSNARKTIKSNIFRGIANTGFTYVPPSIDCAGLVDAIYDSITARSGIWALREISDE